MVKLVLLGVVCTLASLRAFGQSPADNVAIVNAETERPAAEWRQQSFDIVWRTVKEKHFDPTLGGLDWDAVRRKYEPRIAVVSDDRAFHQLLNEMLGELHQSHFGVIPPEAIADESGAKDSDGEIGIDLRMVQGRAVISRVAADSAAARAGLRPGFALLQIEETNVARFYRDRWKKLNDPALANQWDASLKHFFLAQALLRRTMGSPGTSLRLRYLDGRNRARQAVLTRTAAKGEMTAVMGMPPLRADFEARRLPNGAGYIRFNVFLMPVVQKVREAIREFHDAPGIVFDLRGNIGGLGGIAPGMVGMLTTDASSIGTMHTRGGQQKFAFFPQPGAYKGRVAVLIDAGCISTCEIFAAGLQDLGRGTIFGERSAGMVLPSMFEKLPTGAVLQYAFADFKTAKGVLLEGRGVTPDRNLSLNRASLLAGRDPLIEAARNAFRSH